MAGPKEIFVGMQAFSEMAVAEMANLEQKLQGIAQALKAEAAAKGKLQEQVKGHIAREADTEAALLAAREYQIACNESEGRECPATINARIVLFVALSLLDQGDETPAGELDEEDAEDEPQTPNP